MLYIKLLPNELIIEGLELVKLWSNIVDIYFYYNISSFSIINYLSIIYLSSSISLPSIMHDQ